MKRTLLIWCLLAACSQKHQAANNTKTGLMPGIEKIHDTLFIYRKVTKDNYCAVYIEKNRRSFCYNDILNFRMDSDDNVAYKQNYAAIKAKDPAPYRIYDLSGLPKEWVPLYLYNGKYYIYYPSDAGDMGRRFITDSTLNYWYMDGIYPEPIQSLSKLNARTWGFTIHPYDNNSVDTKIMIYIIDPVKGIAVWEDSSADSNNKYELYVSKESAKNFDAVVSFCMKNRTGEFMFDKPDYTRLLKGD